VNWARRRSRGYIYYVKYTRTQKTNIRFTGAPFLTSDTFVLELDVCIYTLRVKETRIDAVLVEDREHKKSIEERELFEIKLACRSMQTPKVYCLNLLTLLYIMLVFHVTI